MALLAFDFVMKLVSKAEMAAVSGVEGLGSLHAWLGQELEVRGIDAVIYTRYILSILQQDSFIPDDLDLAADNHFFPPNRKDAQRGRSTFRNSRKSEKRRPVEIADCEERKKSAAVECLLSLSDEVCPCLFSSLTVIYIFFMIIKSVFALPEGVPLLSNRA